ncbi:hypothetical protein Tco_0178605 [Tanacetum coccineum]
MTTKVGSWSDPRDFAKPVKAISLPQDVPSTSDCRLIKLKNKVQRLMEAHLAPISPVRVNNIASSCEIYSGTHDTQYCMENPEQAFIEYASSRTDEAGGLVSSFMASQDARLSKFEADFKQQQGEMTNKIDTFLKAINDRMTGALPSDTVKNPKLNVNSTSSVFFARSYPMEDPQRSYYAIAAYNCREDMRADGTKSYPVGIVKNVEVHKNVELSPIPYYSPCLVDMEKDPATPLLVGRGFLATASTVIDCKKAKIVVGEGDTISVFGVKEIDL